MISIRARFAGFTSNRVLNPMRNWVASTSAQPHVADNPLSLSEKCSAACRDAAEISLKQSLVTLSGRVYVDANQVIQGDLFGNGMQSVKVELVDVRGNVVAQTLTDQDGHYAFEPMDLYGNFTVRLADSNWLTATSPCQPITLRRGDNNVAGPHIGVKLQFGLKHHLC